MACAAMLAGASTRARADDSASLSRVKQAAERGDATAQTKLGGLYVLGDGVKKDCREAEAWFRRAAVQHHAGAQFSLGALHADGCGVTRNDGEAVRWYRRSAEGGFARALHHLGYMHYAGRGVPQSDATAMKWFRRAVRHPLGVSAAELAIDYDSSFDPAEGLSKDDALLHFWRTIAAEDGKDGTRRLLERTTARLSPQVVARSRQLYEKWQRVPEQPMEDWVYLLLARPEEAQRRLTEAGEKALPALIEALGAAETRLFIWQICDVLMRIGPGGRSAAPVLEQLLASRPTPDHLWIALALAHVDPARGKPAVPALERCLTDLPRDAPVHDTCAAALAAVRGSPK